MKIGAVYKSNGEIIAIQSGSEYGLQADAVNYGGSLVFIDGMVKPEDYYVDNGVFTAKPPKPSPLHTFNYTTKAWELDTPALNAKALADLRRIRDGRLADTDWTQLPDAPVDAAAWQTYRQQLRDLPAAYPDIISVDEVTWPTPPA